MRTRPDVLLRVPDQMGDLDNVAAGRVQWLLSVVMHQEEKVSSVGPLDVARSGVMTSSRDANRGAPTRVYELLRAAIIRQEFRPGERLMISKLADLYRVSNTPVREALNRLREEMLVEFVAGQGYFSKAPNLKELQDLYHLLEALLVFAAGEIIRLSPADARDIDPSIMYTLQLTEAAAAQYADAVESALAGIVGLSGNDAALSVARNALARTHFIRQIDIESPERRVEFCDSLTEFRRAVHRSDQETAQQVVRREVRRKIALLPILVKEAVTRSYVTQGGKRGSR